MYAYLCACLQAPSEMLFSRNVEELVKKKITTSVERKFGQNVPDRRIWQCSYKNMFVESFHNQLKTIFFEGNAIDGLMFWLIPFYKLKKFFL